jgi:lysophospholipase L1-like esterase
MDQWQSSWVRPMADVRAFEVSFTDVTIRTKAVAGLTGNRLRVELSNRFGDVPLLVGRSAITVEGRSVTVRFNGQEAVSIPAGQTRWTDSLDLATRRGDEVLVDLYLPETSAHATGNFARTPMELSVLGDHAGSKVFPAVATPMIPAPDGSEMAVPVPFLRAVEVEGAVADVVVACLGDSITAGGWPEAAAKLLAEGRNVVMLNLGIAGNRLRLDPTPEIASFGRSGLSRFDEDVLGGAGVSDLVIALGTNDLGLPGSVTPESELPTAEEIIYTYSLLVDRATAAGLRVIIATITPFMGSDSHDAARDRIRSTVNAWIRTSAPEMVDFDAAVRSDTAPEHLATKYDSGDHLHPNEQGEERLAEAIAVVLRARLTASKE